MHLLPVEVFLWFLPARRQPAVCVSVCRVSAPWVHHECQSECEWVWVWVSLSASKREQLKVGLNSCKWVRDYVAKCSQCLLLFTFISLFGRNCGNWRKWLPAAACHRFEFVFLCPCRGYTSFVMKYVTHRTQAKKTSSLYSSRFAASRYRLVRLSLSLKANFRTLCIGSSCSCWQYVCRKRLDRNTLSYRN